jgi:drug/metabolite transporter (DMT)-like permease
MAGEMDRPLRGIAYKVLYVLSVTVMLTLIKSVKGVPLWELMFVRSFLSVVPVAAFLAAHGELRWAFRTAKPLGHLTRTLLGLATMGLTFTAVRALPLPEAVTLQYTQPLFVVALSALVLRERVRVFRWTAVAVGFAGVLIITGPKLTLLSSGAVSQVEVIGALATLAAAATLATNILVMGSLVRTERSATIVLWFWLYSSAFLALTWPLGWVMLDAKQALMLTLSAFLGGFSQLLMGESLRYAPASTTAPFEYASLIFATVLGYAVFGDVLEPSTLAGAALVVAAGLAIIWRERRASEVLPV